MELYNTKINELDSILYTDFQLYKEFKTKFKDLLEWVTKEQSQEIQKKAQYDNEIFLLYIQPIILTEYKKIEILLTRISVIPAGDEQLEYYEKRMHDTTNAFLKVRYSHFLFIYGKNENKYQYSQILLPSLVTIIDTYQSCGDDSSSTLAIACLVEISLYMSNIDMLKNAIDLLSSQLAIIGKNDFLNILRCSKILRAILHSNHSKFVSTEISSAVVESLEIIRKSFFENQNYTDYIIICKEYSNYKQLKLINEEKGVQLNIEIGKSYELEAEHQSGAEVKHPLRKAHFLELALTHYKHIGNIKKVNEMKNLIKKTYESKELEESYSTFSTPIAINYDSDINYFTSSSLENNINNLINKDTFIPNKDEISQKVSKQNETSQIFNLVTQSTIHGGKKIAEAKTYSESIGGMATIRV